MKILFPLDSCHQGEFIFNSKGIPQVSPIKHEYYNIYCLLNNKGAKIYGIYYPFIFFSSPNQLFDIVKIGLLAEKNKLKMLDWNEIMPDKEKFVIIYNDYKDEENALLYAYLSQINTKNLIEKMTYNLLIKKLTKIPNSMIKGQNLFLYYRKGLSPSAKKSYHKKYPEELPDFKEEIERRAKFIKDYDNFKDYKEKEAQAKSKVNELEKKLRSSPKYQQFKKKVKTKEFVFPIDKIEKTGLITKKELNDIKKSIK